MAAASSALPVVDLAPFFAEGSVDARGRAGATESVREACLTSGFFRVVNHDVPRELMARALELQALFFVLPDEVKTKVRPAGAVSASAPLPSGEALEECYAELSGLGLLLQEILSESMGLPRGFLGEYNNDRTFDFISVRHSFPATEEDNVGTRDHQDVGCITFVLQDDVGGLEVLTPDGGSLAPVEPIEGSIVVNVGDVVQILSNNKFRSVMHRVVRNPVAHRYSLIFFFNLHGDKWAEPLPEFAGDVGEAPRYKGFRYGEYLRLRGNKTHPPTRPEDIVGIAHYAI
ncbi:unnamed protein product [Alopecurus aequalis]